MVIIIGLSINQSKPGLFFKLSGAAMEENWLQRLSEGK